MNIKKQEKDSSSDEEDILLMELWKKTTTQRELLSIWGKNLKRDRRVIKINSRYGTSPVLILNTIISIGKWSRLIKLICLYFTEILVFSPDCVCENTLTLLREKIVFENVNSVTTTHAKWLVATQRNLNPYRDLLNRFNETLT